MHWLGGWRMDRGEGLRVERGDGLGVEGGVGLPGRGCPFVLVHILFNIFVSYWHARAEEDCKDLSLRRKTAVCNEEGLPLDIQFPKRADGSHEAGHPNLIGASRGCPGHHHSTAQSNQKISPPPRSNPLQSINPHAGPTVHSSSNLARGVNSALKQSAGEKQERRANLNGRVFGVVQAFGVQPGKLEN